MTFYRNFKQVLSDYFRLCRLVALLLRIEDLVVRTVNLSLHRAISYERGHVLVAQIERSNALEGPKQTRRCLL